LHTSFTLLATLALFSSPGRLVDPRPGHSRPAVYPLARLRFLVRLLQILPRFVLSPFGVVVGLKGVTVFVRRALSLSGHIEDLSQLDVRPNFCPTGISIAVDGFAICVGGRLVVALLEKHFGDAVVRQ
jgi:hypothetical protein